MSSRARVYFFVSLYGLIFFQRGSERSSVHSKLLMSAVHQAAMSQAPYAFVCCMATGAPWSEQQAGTSFDEFMQRAFGCNVDGVPSEEQDVEFSCAHPSRNGSNSLMKGPQACNHPDARETPRVIIAVRGLWRPRDNMPIIRSPLPGKSVTNSG